jgi:hypothetical protein
VVIANAISSAKQIFSLNILNMKFPPWEICCGLFRGRKEETSFGFLVAAAERMRHHSREWGRGEVLEIISCIG